MQSIFARRPRRAPLSVAAFAVLGALLLSPLGCGGGSGPAGSGSSGGSATAANDAGSGRVVFRVAWPAADASASASSRLIPQAAQSIEFRILDGAKLLKTEVLARPATEVTVKDLPAKKLMSQVRTFPNADATGVAQAEGQVEMEIKPDETVKVAVTLQSTIERLAPSLEGTQEVDEGGTLTLAATPRNAAGEMVLIRPGALRWISSAPDVATVDANGVVTALKFGDVVIEATEPESGKTVRFTVRVGLTGRLAYTEITSNVTGNNFVPQSGEVGEDDITDFNDVPIPNLTFRLQDNYPNVERRFEVTLPPNPTQGTTYPIGRLPDGTICHAEHLEVRGNDERRFWGFTEGSVTVVKIEGRTYTFRLENVRMVATGVDRSDAVGTFLVNGSFSITDTR